MENHHDDTGLKIPIYVYIWHESVSYQESHMTYAYWLVELSVVF